MSKNEIQSIHLLRLSVYLAQIKKFPMLDAEEEYMLAKNWRKWKFERFHKPATAI